MFLTTKEDIYLRKFENCRNRMLKKILKERIPFNASFAVSKESVSLDDSFNLERKPIKEGDKWGEVWDSGYFRLEATVPKEWKNEKIAANLDFTGEALVYSKEGPLYGLTNGSVFDKHYSKDVYRVLDKAKGGESIEIFVEVSAVHQFGVQPDRDYARGEEGRFGSINAVASKMSLCIFDDELWHLTLDMEILLGMLKSLNQEGVRKARIERALNEAVNAYAEEPKNASLARSILKPLLDYPATASALTAISVGHAHIDTGWLWPISETFRKCARTYSSQLDLIEKYPGYIFGASQPQHYEFVKERYPKLYSRIKDAVKKGKWELQGGMWVEADCNIISGESMVRQFLHGKNFFMDEFGEDVKNCWLPDVFGYSAAMPQIMKRAGVDFFLTQKLSWSQFNTFPHTTFNWRGVDGSEVITHFPPEDNYNSNMVPAGLVKAEKRFKEKAYLDEYIVLFGIGDGGGGPKEEYVERAFRMKNTEGLSKIKLDTAKNFFLRLESKKEMLPVWSGELYLELHRATLTTQSRTKRNNRMLENALRKVEHLSSCFPLDKYPLKELDRLWKTLLLHQFHDILPGSSINLVYKQADEAYQKAFKEIEEITENIASSFMEKDENSLVLFNCLSYTYTQKIKLPDDWKGASREDGEIIHTQKTEEGVYVSTKLPPHSFIVLKKASGKEIKPYNKLVLENSLVRYGLNENAEIVEAFDKETNTSILPDGEKANVLSLYIDYPQNWDAWDIDFHYDEQLVETADGKLLGGDEGEVGKSLVFELKIGDSILKQRVFLEENSKRLDFKTEANWNEYHKLLRVNFPVNITSNEASFDIQYAYTKRSTHTNTSWDFARFEVAAQKYADLSNENYGVSLLNDCKYGYRVQGNVISLSLLRAPTQPDPDADLGEHIFTYSLLPHKGRLVDSSVIGEAEMLNVSPIIINGSKTKAFSPLNIQSKGVSMSVIKKAEKENAIVIRLVETLGKYDEAIISAYSKANFVKTDLMEWEEEEKTQTESLTVVLKPFEIQTYKVYF